MTIAMLLRNTVDVGGRFITGELKRGCMDGGAGGAGRSDVAAKLPGGPWALVFGALATGMVLTKLGNMLRGSRK
eukprot:365594-Chlamydomonas_euryale.AAC.10